MSRWGQVAPLVSALAVAGLVVGVSVSLGGGGGEGPPVLRLAAAGAADERASSAVARGPGYRVTGSLPEGPDEARAHDLGSGAAPLDRVRALATALGVAVPPVRDGAAWRAGELVVRSDPGHPWSFGESSCGPDSSVSSDGDVVCAPTDPAAGGGTSGSGGSEPSRGQGSAGGPSGSEPSSGKGSSGPAPGPAAGGRACPASYGGPSAASGCPKASDARVCPVPAEPCATASDGVTRPAAPPRPGRPVLPPRPAMTEEQALAATQRLRSALGLDDAELSVRTSPGGADVTAEPRVAGLRTSGMATVLSLGPDRRLRAAHGWLGSARPAASYPLVGARDALGRLAPVTVGAPCAASECPDEPAVSGAELGLVLTPLAGGRAALLPAWLFALESSAVLPVLAVEDRYLVEDGQPEPAAPDDTPGTAEPDPAGTTKPTEPTSGSRQAMPFDGALRHEDPRVLTVRYGATCTSGVTGSVKESADTVVVLLEQDPQPPDRACPAIYEAAFLDLRLGAPLGKRRVVDASSGREVPVATCPSRTEMCPT